MAVRRARSGSRVRMASRRSARGRTCAISSRWWRSNSLDAADARRTFGTRMATFGGFRRGDEFFFGEVRDEQVFRLTSAPWLGGQPEGRNYSLGELLIEMPVAPSKLIAVGLNYA